MFSRRADPSGFSDDDLRFAAQAVRNSMLSSLEKDLEPRHTFSEAFLRRMQELFRLDARRNMRKRVFQHAAILIIGFFLSGLLFLAFNPEARADFTRWVRSVYENSIFYQSLSDENLGQSESVDGLPEVEFSWLPGDYEIQVLSDSPLRRRIRLVGSENSILLEYWFINEADYVEVFTDEYSHEFVTIHGSTADFYLSKVQDAYNTLVWTVDGSSVICSLNANLEKDILVRIANNIFFK